MQKQKIRTILIEDDVEIEEYILSLLKDHEDIEIVATYNDFSSALNGFKLIETDLAIVDIHLGGESGIDLVRQLKPQLPNIQFVMYTSLFDSETIFAALKAGATGYLTKETSSEKLIEAIKDAHHGGSPMSSDIARKIVKSFHEHEKHATHVQLSQRETEIIHLLSKGLRYKEIAYQLFLSTETVRTHIRNIYEKLQVNSRTDALNKYF